MSVLVTGAAGFIGFHLCQRLLSAGRSVVGLDNLNDYYSVALKEARLNILRAQDGFSFFPLDVVDAAALDGLFAARSFPLVIHLAAQAGVRYSRQNPQAYVQSNLVGFANILEACRRQKTGHLVYASSSSVYGDARTIPFRESLSVNHPLNLYAATKRSNELMAHVYSHLYGLPCTGLRFFTVYGPWGRPDMAVYLFTQAILAGEPIQVFQDGRLQRDFTYIDDTVEAVIRIAQIPAAVDADWDPWEDLPNYSRTAPFRLYNIGQGRPERVSTLVALLEKYLDRKALVQYLPRQPEDGEITFADNTDLREACGFIPNISLEDGVARFVRWYREYHGLAR
ncbi:MAG: NAD-dependent epimerase/dehydratase family protein [Deltaproteobacteria bacterium]|jgi:UDP-glucuronate 4-epimerase|nr:NAD-dependent epimerase/dehydratase family protein [Deltaproteobacteria bacterium]